MIYSRNKNNILVTAFLIAVTNFLYAQNYSITPNDSIVGTVPFNDIYHFNIYQNNLTTGDLVFSYQKIYTSYPIGWTANLCDNGTCFDEFPDSGTMDTVFNGDVGLMSVGVNPGEIAGVSFMQYIIWESATPELVDTLTWIISAEAPNAIQDASTALNLFLNPTNQNLVVQTSLLTGFDYFIYDMQGRLIQDGHVYQASAAIRINDLINGIYFISVLGDNNNLTSKHFFISN